MVPIIAIVGYADSGKTTLIERLVPELKKKGFRIGTIKHSAHGSDFDTRGKDSWRHYTAGADMVAVASEDQVALFKRRLSAAENPDNPIFGLEQYFEDMDLVIAEGFKNAKIPKVEVFRSDVSDSPLRLNDEMLMAIVTDAELDVGVPVFKPFELEGLAEMIVHTCL